MTIPKWLLPVISVIAAVAVGVALAIVGTNFASKVVADHPASTEKLPVLGPVATGAVTSSQVKLASAGKLPASKVTGQATVVTPGASLSSTGLQQAVRRIADGHASGDGPNTPASGSGSTPTPTPTPDASPAPSGSSDPQKADDPCAPPSGNPPAGCPDGTLHGAIFADTMPPQPDFTIQPFTSPCATAPINPQPGNYADVPVLITTTVPLDFSIEWSIHTPSDQSPGWSDFLRYSVGSDQTGPWYSALASDTPRADLPPLTVCAILPHIYQSHLDSILIRVYGTTLPPGAEQEYTHDYLFRPDGATVLPDLELQTFESHDYFVAYTENIPGQTLAIRAYDTSRNDEVTCDDIRSSPDDPEISPVGDRLIGSVNPQSTTLNLPLEYSERDALGFIVQPGSETMVCAYWYHGRDVPSFSRATPYHTSTFGVQSPAATLPTLSVHAISTHAQVTDVTASGSTMAGENCGSAQLVANEQPLIGTRTQPDRQICQVPANVLDDETVDPSVRGNLVVSSDVTTTGGQHVLGRYVLNGSSFGCPAPCAFGGGHEFVVQLPADPATGTSLGAMLVVQTWHVVDEQGLGLTDWLPFGQYSYDSPPNIPASLPQLDTDFALLDDPTDAVPNSAAAVVFVQADQDADYTVTITGVPGAGPTCTIGNAALTQTGHVSDADPAIPVVFTHLCFNTLYLATITLTNANGSTRWGWQSGNNLWHLYLARTSGGTVHLQFVEVLMYENEVPTVVFDHVSMHVDGHTGARPTNIYNGGSCGTGYDDPNRTADLPVSGNVVTLHFTYQLHHGQYLGEPEGCDIYSSAGYNPPLVDITTDLNLSDIAANPDGVTVRSDRVAITVALAPAS